MGFQQGLSGLNASSKQLDVIGNNVSNAGTIGFKSATAQFADVFAASLAGGGGSQVGIGTTVSGITQQFTQGNITVTNNPLDLAINGQGMFRLSDNGSISWTRNGQFQVDKNGYVVNASGAHLQGYLANASGVIVPSTPADILINTSDLQPQATTTAKLGLNLDSRETVPTVAAFAPSNPLSYNDSTSVTVYDSLGNPHVMALYFVKSATANEWSLYTQLDGTTPAAPTATTLNFSTTGALTTPATGVIGQSFAIATGAVPTLTFNLTLTGSTQFGNIFGVNNITQDGFTSGRLAGLSVASDGTLQGRYSNGQSRNLAQFSLGNFNNPQGLSSLGNNQWQETPESGQPLIGIPGSGSLGVVQSAAIEESNVDLTAELVSMITAQRAYQASAQTIKTQDQILQTLVNLR